MWRVHVEVVFGGCLLLVGGLLTGIVVDEMYSQLVRNSSGWWVSPAGSESPEGGGGG